MLPNFIIVGAPKAGTTSLYHYLSEHPEIYMSNPKEVNYFSREDIEKQNLYYNSFKVNSLIEYEKLFKDSTNQKAIGEASVSYLFYKNVPAKIKKLIPNAKIIILLREPISRGFSHYLMDYKLGLIDDHYEDIVFKKSTDKNLNLYYQQYVELGLYYEQIKRYLDVFGIGQVKIILQEDLYKNTNKVIKNILTFLKVENSFMPDISSSHNVFSSPKNKIIRKVYSISKIRSAISIITPTKLKKNIKKIFFKYGSKPVLNSEVKKYLFNIYIDDIKKLETLLKFDLSKWKDLNE